jgi:hypothetical protein
MSNHYHIVTRVDPKKAKSWSKEEVVRRWNQIYPVKRDKRRNPIESIRSGDDDLGWLITLEEYLQILDTTGRCIKDGKKGYIPEDLSPILLRMNLDQDHWLETVQKYGSKFYRVIGCVERMAETAKRAGQKWFKGLNFSKLVYRPT